MIAGLDGAVVLVTADDELLASIPPARRGIDDLVGGPRTSELRLGPLPRDARRELRDVKAEHRDAPATCVSRTWTLFPSSRRA